MIQTAPIETGVQVPVDAFLDNVRGYQTDVWNRFYEHPEIRHWVLVWHRRARKTTLAINLLIAEAATTEDKTYAYIGPTMRQAKATVWRDPMMLKRYLPDNLLAKPFNETELFGEFKSGSVLHIGGADDPDRWRGSGIYGWVLDEFAMMRNGNYLYNQIIFPIIQENGGWVLFTYTPKGRNHGWDFWQKAQEKDDWWGKILDVTQSNALTAEDIQEARTAVPEDVFQQEFMCAFLVSGGGIIKRVDEACSGKLLRPQKDARGLPVGRYVMGVDVAKLRDWTVCSVINRDTKHLDGWERFNKIDYTFQVEKIAAMAKKFNDPLIIIDSTGVGEAIYDMLVRLNLSVRPYSFTSSSKKNLVEKLIMAVESRQITYPPIPTMVDELKDFEIDEKGRYGAPVGLKDDCVFSLALAVEGMGQEAFQATPDPRKIRAQKIHEQGLDKKMRAGNPFEGTE